MERPLFSEEHAIFRESVRRFFQKEIEPCRDRFADQGHVDPEAFRKAGEQGLLCFWVDEEYGGSGIDDYRFDQIIIEENARHGDPGFFITLHNRLVTPYIEGLGTSEQKKRFLPGCVSGACILGIAMTEDIAGSNLAGMKTSAVRKGDAYVLNGKKTYISNGIIGDLFVVAARTGGEGSREIGLFLVERDTPGFTSGRKLKKLGLPSQDTTELFLENVQVPVENVLGDPSRGFYYLMQYLVDERLSCSCMSTANARAAFDMTMDYVRTRPLFDRMLGDFQVTRFKMADMKMAIEVAQTYVDQCVMQFNARKLTKESAAIAKLFATEMEGRVVDECLQLHGGAGYMDEYRISRMYRDSRVSRIYAGSSEVMREIISRSLGLDPRKK